MPAGLLRGALCRSRRPGRLLRGELAGRQPDGGFQTAPIGGTLKSLDVSAGQTVEAGDSLAVIVS